MQSSLFFPPRELCLIHEDRTFYRSVCAEWCLSAPFVLVILAFSSQSLNFQRQRLTHRTELFEMFINFIFKKKRWYRKEGVWSVKCSERLRNKWEQMAITVLWWFIWQRRLNDQHVILQSLPSNGILLVFNKPRETAFQREQKNFVKVSRRDHTTFPCRGHIWANSSSIPSFLPAQLERLKTSKLLIDLLQ